MKKFLIILFFINTKILFSQIDYSKFVNPFIGTGGHGHTFPGATTPFGMVQLSPDTRIDGSWDGSSGYHFSDSLIFGFSHTHLSGTGVSDYGDILFVPTKIKPDFKMKQYSVGFSHKNENATAGYYSVLLNDKIFVELTSSPRVGMHKYTFPKNSEKWIIVNLEHRDKTIEADLKIISNKKIMGMRRSSAWAQDQHIYFSAEFSEPFIENFYSNNKFAFKFKSNKKEILVKVGISNVSMDGAEKNLQTEIPHFNFNKVVVDAKNLWNSELGKISVSDENQNNKIIFYTALYHTMIHPNLNMDVDRKYRGMDNQIHEAKDFDYYTVFSLWDTFRAAHPLYTLIDKKRTTDFIKTFLTQFSQSGRLPVWELCGNETDCMIGYHSASVITDAYLKGINSFDTSLALKAMLKSANWNNFGLLKYIENDFLKIEDENESVSKTLEYAYDDWCISQFAKKFGDEIIYNEFLIRSQSYKNLFNNKTGFMHPRTNGGWLENFDPKEVNNNFTEANSWQYSFFVPHDISGLISLYNGAKNFENKLDELFNTDSKTTGRIQSDITGLIGQYAHGNEPSHATAYLYNYIGKSEKTQFRVNQILNNFYKNSPDGLIGNEDCGQMSAWYVLSALGLYQVCPGKPEFTITTPIFNQAIINLENGNKIEINTNKKNEDELYISKINNENFYKINYDELSNGKILNFEVSNKINSSFKNYILPETKIIENLIISAPEIFPSKKSFKDSIKIEIYHPSKDAKIYFSINDLINKNDFQVYNSPISIYNNSKIKAFVMNNEGLKSPVITGEYLKFPNNWKIKLKNKFSNQYSAGGVDGIVDGIFGDKNWRKGFWQGYEKEDFEIVIDLNEKKNIETILISTLQDLNSWIFFPKEILFFSSDDAKNYILFNSLSNKSNVNESEIEIKKFESNKKINSRFIKIIAKNIEFCPSWHKASGEKAWLFVDEVVIK